MQNIDTIVISMGGQGKRISQDLKKRGINTSKVFLEINGKPILNHLIDMALGLNFKQIFLLSSYYESDLRFYISKNYKNNNRIIPIYGGKMGRKLGVPWLIYSIKSKLTKPFVYSDGNILYKSSILKKLKKDGCGKETIVRVVVSKKDHAFTHSRLLLHEKDIDTVITRLQPNRNKKSAGKQYYSLGLMILNNSIFSLIPKFSHKKDLDYVVEDAHLHKKESIEALIYKGKWIAVHTIADIDKLKIKY